MAEPERHCVDQHNLGAEEYGFRHRIWSRGRGGPPATGPIAYTVQVSMDGTTWGSPVAQGTVPSATTIATFRPVQAKFIRVTQMARATTGEIWAIQQVRVYAAGR